MTDDDVRQAFIDGMSLAAASVSIVTTDGPAGRQGVTVSAMTPAPDGDKFNAAGFDAGPTGAPRLKGALVSFDCRLVSADKIGTHHICIGAVEDVTVSQGSPLLYGMRSYLRAEKH